MNLMSLNDYSAKIEYDAELDMFRGEILGLTGGADFYGKNPKELRAEFKKSLQVFLDVAARRASSRDSATQANSISVSPPSCTRNSPSSQKPRARA